MSRYEIRRDLLTGFRGQRGARRQINTQNFEDPGSSAILSATVCGAIGAVAGITIGVGDIAKAEKESTTRRKTFVFIRDLVGTAALTATLGAVIGVGSAMVRAIKESERLHRTP